MIVLKLFAFTICLSVFAYYILIFFPILRLCKNYKMKMGKFALFLQVLNIFLSAVVGMMILALQILTNLATCVIVC